MKHLYNKTVQLTETGEILWLFYSGNTFSPLNCTTGLDVPAAKTLREQFPLRRRSVLQYVGNIDKFISIYDIHFGDM